MARTRYIKPDFFKDEDLALLPFEVRLLYAGLWSIADKAGRLEDRPMRIKAEIFPYDPVNIEDGLCKLSKPKNGSGHPFIVRYEDKSQKYIQILNWRKHQSPHSTEKDSTIPPPDLNALNLSSLNLNTLIPYSVHDGTPTLNNESTSVKQPLKRPSLEEVKEYCLERNNSIDAEAFLAYYDANGWVQGTNKKPIKNWKACIITWEKNKNKYGGGNLDDIPEPLRHLFRNKGVRA